VDSGAGGRALFASTEQSTLSPIDRNLLYFRLSLFWMAIVAVSLIYVQVI